MDNPATRPPSRWEWSGLLVLFVTFIAFGGLVELRSAFLSRRMGDLDCYLRAAWAVTTGRDIYDVVVENGWHYNYPPLYAILMVPLADPPLGDDRSGYVPYAVAVAICYVLNIGCLVLAAHLLAGALERNTDNPAYRDQPRFCRRWWALRLWPILVCLLPAGHTAMRGQVNLQILALLCGWIACLLNGRRAWSGFLLAVAVCIKVIPVYLIVYPLWRRDGRALAGCAAGLLLGFVAVPLVAFGPTRAVEEYQQYAQVFFGPLLKLSDDTSREKELLGMSATDSMGIKHALHNGMYPDPLHRPDFHPVEEWANRALAVGLTLAVIWPMRRRRAIPPWRELHEMGALLVLMVALSPISHMHYFIFCLPLVTSLLFRRWQYARALHLGWPLRLAFGWFGVTYLLPTLPPLEWLRDLCVPLFGALPLWAVGVADLWRGQRVAAAETEQRRAA
jgi:hypothetical protein